MADPAGVDALRVWLATEPLARFPTVSTGEALFSVLLLPALFFHARNTAGLARLFRRLRRDPGAGADDVRQAGERLRRTARGLLRLAIWGVICALLLTDHPYTGLVFTLGFFAYLAVEDWDGVVDWLHQRERRAYWRQQDHLAALAVQADRIETALDQNTALTRLAVATSQRAALASGRAEHVANDATLAIQRLESGQHDARGEDAPAPAERTPPA